MERVGRETQAHIWSLPQVLLYIISWGRMSLPKPGPCHLLDWQLVSPRDSPVLASRVLGTHTSPYYVGAREVNSGPHAWATIYWLSLPSPPTRHFNFLHSLPLTKICLSWCFQQKWTMSPYFSKWYVSLSESRDARGDSLSTRFISWIWF